MIAKQIFNFSRRTKSEYLCFYCIACLISGQVYSLEKPMLVEVEPPHLITSDVGGEPTLIPYKSRRSKWGGSVSVGYNTYSPENYESQASNELFSDVYSSGAITELQLSVKRNLSIGSIAGEMNAGLFEVKSDEGMKLSVTMAKIGGKFLLDTLFHEPYLAPYIGGGIYLTQYKETVNSTAFKGTTSLAGYTKGGVLIQLDWIDTEAAQNSYLSAGIENTFLFLEAQMFMASSEEADPDFSGVSYGGGIQIEF